MTKLNVMKDNKLIAEFMGAVSAINHSNDVEWLDLSDCLDMYYGIESVTVKGIWPVTNLKFHMSWDWLMPVVEKILKERRTDYYLMFDMSVSDTFEVSIGNDGKYRGDGQSKNSSIEATYEAVVEFINWYNENK